MLHQFLCTLAFVLMALVLTAGAGLVVFDATVGFSLAADGSTYGSG